MLDVSTGDISHPPHQVVQAEKRELEQEREVRSHAIMDAGQHHMHAISNA